VTKHGHVVCVDPLPLKEAVHRNIKFSVKVFLHFCQSQISREGKVIKN